MLTSRRSFWQVNVGRCDVKNSEMPDRVPLLFFPNHIKHYGLYIHTCTFLGMVFLFLLQVALNQDHGPSVKGTPVAGNQLPPDSKPLTVNLRAVDGSVITWWPRHLTRLEVSDPGPVFLYSP